MEQEPKNLKSRDRTVSGLVLLARSTERSKKENVEMQKRVDDLKSRMFRIEQALNIKN